MLTLRMIKRLIKNLMPKSWLPLTYIHNRTIKCSKGIIQGGPFKGLKYLDKAFASSICSKLVGTYEKEIQTVIQELLNKEFDTLLDIGAAEGYYSVGFAVFGKCKNIVAYDIMNEARSLQEELAQLNNVSNTIKIKGKCETNILSEDLSINDNLIICDVEGYENSLLDIKMIPKLTDSTIIVECHNHVWNQMEESIRQRFSHTHSIKRFKTRTHTYSNEYPFRNFYYNCMPKKYKNYPLIDHRDRSTTWLYLKPLNYN